MDLSPYTAKIDEAVSATPDLFIARIHRYSKPDNKFGWHLIVPQDGGWYYQPLVTQTLGLFTEIDSIQISVNMARHCFIEVDPTEFVIGGCSRFPDGMELQRYLIHQVCPIEFHSKMDAGDPEYLGYLKVFMLGSRYQSGLSKSWAKKSSLEELARLRETVQAERAKAEVG